MECVLNLGYIKWTRLVDRQTEREEILMTQLYLAEKHAGYYYYDVVA